MQAWIQQIVGELGYVGIVGLMILENLFPPIPSEIVMPMAGFATVEGRLSFVPVVLAGTAGSVLGALPLYFAGRWVGEDRLRRWARDHGKWLAIRVKDVETADRWFDRHGGGTVFFCRLVPGVRSLISIPAGMAEMPLVPFLLYTALGTGLWALLLAYLGRVFQARYEEIGNTVGTVAWVVGVVLAVSAVLWIAKRKASR